jgi:hypothetical protein
MKKADACREATNVAQSEYEAADMCYLTYDMTRIL